jgi:hypothetical protein
MSPFNFLIMRAVFLCFLTFLLLDKLSAQIIQDINLPNGLINNPRSIQATSDNGFIISGNNSLGLTGYFSTEIIKLDSTLNVDWIVDQPPRLLLNPTYSVVCSDGGILINDTKDILNSNSQSTYSQGKILKYKPNGILDWEYTFNQPYWNWTGAMTEINGDFYILWQRFLEHHYNSNAQSEWHVLKFSSNGDSIGSINITDLSPPGMFFKVYKDLITTSDGQLLLSGWGQTWLPSLLSNPINQAVSVPLLQKIDLTGDLIWDYSELPEHKEVPYQAQFWNVEELPCGDIVAFGVKKNNFFNGYVIRLDANGQHLNSIIHNQNWNEFMAGTSYQNCGFIAVGYLRLNISPIARGSLIAANNEFNQEVINTSITNYPQETEEVVYDICPLKNDPNKFAMVMRNLNASRVVIIGDFQNELTVPETPEQGDIAIFPNPSDGIFQVSSISTEPMRITMLDQQGKHVAQFDLDELSSDNSFDLSDQTPGVYFAHIMQGEQQWVKKLVVR